MNTKARVELTLMLIFLLVLTLPTAIAENQPLSEYESKHLASDTVGMLNNGIREVTIVYEEYNDTVIYNTHIAFFNTKNESVIIDVDIEDYWEERRVHTVKNNYTYGNLPDLSWIIVPETIEIEPNSRYIVSIEICMPKDEAYAEREEGGYLCLVSAKIRGIETGPSQKLFLTLLTNPVVNKEKDNPGINLLWYQVLSIVIVTVVIIFIIYKKFEIVEVEEDIQ